MHLLDRVDQVGQAFQREVLALHRDDDAVRAHRPFSVSSDSAGGQSIRMKSYSASTSASAFRQPAFAVVQLDQFDFGAGQFAIRRQHVVAAGFGAQRALRAP